MIFYDDDYTRTISRKPWAIVLSIIQASTLALRDSTEQKCWVVAFRDEGHRVFRVTTQRLQNPLTKEYTLNYNTNLIRFKVYSLIKGFWSL